MRLVDKFLVDDLYELLVRRELQEALILSEPLYVEIQIVIQFDDLYLALCEVS